jgi:hypothetical protein
MSEPDEKRWAREDAEARAHLNANQQPTYKGGEKPQLGDRFTHPKVSYVLVVMEIKNGGYGVINAGWPNSYWQTDECNLKGRGDLYFGVKP